MQGKATSVSLLLTFDAANLAKARGRNRIEKGHFAGMKNERNYQAKPLKNIGCKKGSACTIRIFLPIPLANLGSNGANFADFGGNFRAAVRIAGQIGDDRNNKAGRWQALRRR